eukprot:TRINITY_DN4521_c0_g1_i2.p1 TRINITY_DN4521_c0_g1~~TRINITY_DN4521_c0_g1_i2.p1  ORF type:complete len:296 (+),score=34.95 TRINITY_DN4521_c0_g1_i2:13-900(+)
MSEDALLLVPNQDAPPPVQLTEFQKEWREFASWRHQWLLSIVILFFGPVLLMWPTKFQIWFLMNLTGWIYVSVCNCSRSDPFSHRNRDEGYQTFIRFMMATPALYFLGPYWSLVEPSNDTPIIFWEFFNQLETRTGIWYFYAYTYSFYIIPFFISLHFTYLDRSPFLQQIMITREALAKLTAGHWLILIPGFFFVMGLISYQMILMVLHDRWYYYVIGVSAYFALKALYILYLRIRGRNYHIHIHHNQIGAFLFMLAPFQNPVSAVMQAIAAGVYVEGCARWGIGGGIGVSFITE